jgi:hypothetical protein
MSTRSTIAVQHLDGTVSSIYCRYDGSLSGVGVTLARWYNQMDKAEYLITAGSVQEVHDSVEYTFQDDNRYLEDAITYSTLDEYFDSDDFQECNYLWTEHDDENGNRVDGWLYIGYEYADWTPVSGLLDA